MIDLSGIFLLFFVLLLCESCGNNEIYFDKNKCAIYTESHLLIKKLYLNSSNSESFIIIRLKKEKDFKDTFKLFQNSNDFDFYSFRGQKLKGYKFKPACTYEFTNASIPDATPITLKIRIDSSGTCNEIRKN